MKDSFAASTRLEPLMKKKAINNSLEDKFDNSEDKNTSVKLESIGKLCLTIL